jgi:hypothetical protein
VETGFFTHLLKPICGESGLTGPSARLLLVRQNRPLLGGGTSPVFAALQQLLAENSEIGNKRKTVTIGATLSVYSIAPKVSNLTVFPSTEPSDFSEK